MKKFLANLVYMLLSLPLGVLYFTVLTVGITLGLSLSITLIGIPILVSMIFIIFILGDLERGLTSKLLGISIRKPEARPANGESSLAILTAQIKNINFWKELIFLFLRMPLGIFLFTLAIVAVTTSLSLLASPLLVGFFPQANFMILNQRIHTVQGTLPAFGVGVLFSVVTFFIINTVSDLMGKITAWALGSSVADGN